MTSAPPAISIRPRIRNREALLRAGNVALRRELLDIAEEALAASDPGDAVRRTVSLDRGRLVVNGYAYDLAAGNRIYVVGAGKATYPIAAALEEILGDRITDGVIVAKYGQDGALDRLRLRHAAHPVPDTASLAAAQETTALLGQVRAGDIVIACFTGGSSTLFVDPIKGVSLADKVRCNSLLLGSGASIFEINAVRKHLSRVKGGNLARRLSAGTRLINLTVSDVVGDRLDYVTDLTVPDTSTFADACAVLDRYELWDSFPETSVRHLRARRPEAETTRPGDLAHLDRQDVLLLAADCACRAASAAAAARGIEPMTLSVFFEGESSEVGRSFAAIARQVRHDGRPVAAPCLLIGGGETIVGQVHGGAGGPNQEFAVAAAIDIDGLQDVAVLGLDTDGTDGPTAAAGGLVDGSTFETARGKGIDLNGALRRHDVLPALEALGSSVVTGATGTNVNDLKLVVIAARSP